MPSKANIAEFTRGIRAVQQATRREMPKIVNRALLNVAYRAMEYTEYADPGKIQSELYRDNMLVKIATAWLVNKQGRAMRGRSGDIKRTKGGKIKYHGAITRAKIAAAATRFLRIRISSSKAARASWIPSIRDLGGAIRGDAKQKQGSTAAKGGAIRASLSRMFGQIKSTLITKNAKGSKTDIGAIAMAERALDKAVAKVARENLDYAQGKIEAVLRQHSDR